MTIKEIFERYAKAQENKTKLESKIADLLNKQANEAQAMQAAAEAGDLAEYTKRRKSRDLLQDEIDVTRAQLAKADAPINEEEAREVWEEHAKHANGQIKKAWQAYLQARQDLFKKFMALIDAERPAMQAREDLARLIDQDMLHDNKDIARLERTFPLEAVRNNEIINDREFFRRTGYISLDEDQKIGLISGRGRTYI